MEALHLFIAAIGLLLLLQGTRTLRQTSQAGAIAERASGVEASSDFRKSYSYRILCYPEDARVPRSGLSSMVDDHPILMAVLIVVFLGFVAVIIFISVGNPLAVTALAGLAIGLAFASGPYRISVLEQYTAMLLSASAAQLSAHDAHAARVVIGPLRTWNWAKSCFALSILITLVLPFDLLFLYLMLVPLIAFVALGTYYNLGRGIFAEPAKDSTRPDEQWVERLLSEIMRTG